MSETKYGGHTLGELEVLCDDAVETYCSCDCWNAAQHIPALIARVRELERSPTEIERRMVDTDYRQRLAEESAKLALSETEIERDELRARVRELETECEKWHTLAINMETHIEGWKGEVKELEARRTWEQERADVVAWCRERMIKDVTSLYQEEHNVVLAAIENEIELGDHEGASKEEEG